MKRGISYLSTKYHVIPLFRNQSNLWKKRRSYWKNVRVRFEPTPRNITCSICTISYLQDHSHFYSAAVCIAHKKVTQRTQSFVLFRTFVRYSRGKNSIRVNVLKLYTRVRTELFREVSCNGEWLRKRLVINVENGHLTEGSSCKDRMW